jgi:hypothetical protein
MEAHNSYGSFMVERINSINITVLWIHHLLARQEYGVAMKKLLHHHLNLTAWQAEHTLCLNGRQPRASIHIKIAMMITMRDKSTMVMLLCLLNMITGDKLRTTMNPTFIVS